MPGGLIERLAEVSTKPAEPDILCILLPMSDIATSASTESRLTVISELTVCDALVQACPRVSMLSSWPHLYVARFNSSHMDGLTHF